MKNKFIYLFEQIVKKFLATHNSDITVVIPSGSPVNMLIANTIKITIFSRKREIEIMRLVGASNFSIKQPFVIEGFTLGFFGSLIPIGITLYGY